MRKREETRRFWSEVVDRYRRAGVTQAAFAAEQKVGLAALRYWTSKLGRETKARKGQPELQLVPVRVRRPPAAPAGPRPGRVEVRLGAVAIRVRVGTDLEYLAGVVTALRAALC